MYPNPTTPRAQAQHRKSLYPTVIAKNPGTCPTCMDAIVIGDTITKVPGGGVWRKGGLFLEWMHADCEQDQKTPKVDYIDFQVIALPGKPKTVWVQKYARHSSTPISKKAYPIEKLDKMLNWCAKHDWATRSWGKGTPYEGHRAFNGNLFPIRYTSQIKRLDRKIRSNPEKYPGVNVHDLDFRFDW